MSTAYLVRSPPLHAVSANGSLGPVPDLPHDLIALYEKPRIKSLTVSTRFDFFKPSHKPKSGVETRSEPDLPSASRTPSQATEKFPTDDHVLNSPALTPPTPLAQIQPGAGSEVTFLYKSSDANDTKIESEVKIINENTAARQFANWEDFTSKEKEQCRGTQCPSLRLGKTAWFITGPLRESYSKGLEKLIRRLINANHKGIFQHSRSGLNFSPVLLGVTDSIDEAEPVVLLLTGDSKLGHRARNVVLQSSQYLKHSLGFKIEVDVRPILHPSDGVGLSAELNDTALNNLCSKIAFIKRARSDIAGDDEESTWARTTIGGVLIIRGCYYAMTVAHCLLPNQHNYVEEINDVDDSDMDMDMDMDMENEFVDVASLDEEFNDYSLNEPSMPTPTVASDFDVLLDATDLAPNQPDMLEHTSAVEQPSRTALLGRISEVDSDRAHVTRDRLVSFENDWALVPIKNPLFQRPNQFWVPGHGLKVVDRIRRPTSEFSEIVFVATGTSGTRRASIVEKASNYTFPWTSKVKNVFTIDIAIGPGDSGAWIFDGEGYLYGIAVATVPSLSITYALRIEDVFAEISSSWRGEIDVDCFLPKHHEIIADKASELIFSEKAFPALHKSSSMKDILQQDTLNSEQTLKRSTDSKLSRYKLHSLLCMLYLVTFAHFFDLSVLVNALPTITDHFNTVADMGWYSSAYWICMSVLQFPARKMLSFFTDTSIYLISLTVFEIGCLICGFAQTSFMFIAGRIVAGVGRCGLVIASFDILNRLTSSNMKSKAIQLFIIASYSGQVAGHLIGGSLAQHASWRWCFWINPPMGAAAMCGLLILRIWETGELRGRRLSMAAIWRLDLVGFILSGSACIMLVLWLQFGGTKYSWNSPTMIGLIVGSAVAACLVSLWAWFDVSLWYRVGIKRTIVLCCNYLTVMLTFGSFCITTFYLPVWFQSIKQQSAMRSAICTLPTIGIAAIVAFIAGTLVQQSKHVDLKWFIVLFASGTFLQTIGAGLICTLDQTARIDRSIGYQFLIGIGSGLIIGQPINPIQVRNWAIERTAGVTIVLLMQSIGAAVLVAVVQAVFTNSLQRAISDPTTGINGTAIVHSGATNFLRLAQNNVDQEQALVSAYVFAVTNVFFVSAGCSAVACLSALMMVFLY